MSILIQNNKKNIYKKNFSNSKSNKSLTPCANPVFEEWLTEWKNDAVARDLNSRHIFTKCLVSLRKYPLPLKTGKECIILEGFGDKICKMIDEKLKKFQDDGGTLHEDESEESLPNEALNTENFQNKSDLDDQILATINLPTTSNQEILVKPISKLTKSQSFEVTSISRPVLNIQSKKKSDNQELTSSQNEPKNKRSKSLKEYIPEYRSGAYALLVALYKNATTQENENVKDYMLKNELLKDAQKYSDSSFKPIDHKNHYSAWNSMSTLIKKNLVEKENKLPARYKLTESGRQLAIRLLYGITDKSEEKLESTESENENEKEKHSNETLNFSSSDHEKYSQITRNELFITESIIKEDFSKIPNKSGTYTQYYQNGCIEIIDSDSDVISLNEDDNLAKKSNLFEDDASDDLPDLNEEFTIKNNQNYNSARNYSLEKTGLTQPMASNCIINSQYQNCSSVFSTSPKSNNMPRGTLINKEPIITTETSFNFNKILTPTALATFPPGSFEVILFIDNCEQSHAKRQDLLLDELKKANIVFDTGKLSVGDFAWIARQKNDSNYFNTALVLDFIVERKRMDDFCQSIIDGRYKEQKFRLKKCGVKNIIYLIESYGSMKHLSLPEKTIFQADVNTQLINGFLVHHTNDPKDSAHYLIEMTKYVTNYYQKQTLNACLKASLDEYQKFNQKRKDNQAFLLTLSEFNQFSNKNKPMSIKEMFAKCLMKIQGVSQEKAIAIIDIYLTPWILINEYSKCKDDANRIKMIGNLKYGPQQRNIGPAIGKIVAQLFYTNGPLN